MSGPLPDGDTLGLGLEPTPCVVLGPSGCAPALERILRERGLEPRVVSDPWLAMAELCLCEREQAAHASWGLDSAGRLALVIDDSALPANGTTWPESVRNELIDAVRWYLPGVAVWRFAGATLVPIAAAETPRPRATEAVAPRRIPPAGVAHGASAPVEPPDAGEPRLRLTGEAPARPAPERARDEAAPPTAQGEPDMPEPPMVSREEIDMLLGRAPRAGRRPKS